MKLVPITEGLWLVDLGFVNAYIYNSVAGLTLVDAGTTKHSKEVVAAITAAGFAITDLKHIILTHLHPDHSGSAAQLQQLSGARVYAHQADAPLIEKGLGKREDKPLKPSPGVVSRIFALMMPLVSSPKVPPVKVDIRVKDGDTINNELLVVHTPGHTAGHVCLLSTGVKKILFAADLCMNMSSLNWSMVYEDIDDGRKSIEKIAGKEFDIAVFGHGHPILQKAAEAFRKAKFWK